MPMNSGRDFVGRPTDVSQPIMAGGPAGGNQGGDYLVDGLAVRRLTPRECERLQGFHDDWTRIRVRHYARKRVTKLRPVDRWERAEDGGWWLMAADGPRYMACGNSMAVNVMRWIGERIALYERLRAEGRVP